MRKGRKAPRARRSAADGHTVDGSAVDICSRDGRAGNVRKLKVNQRIDYRSTASSSVKIDDFCVPVCDGDVRAAALGYVDRLRASGGVLDDHHPADRVGRDSQGAGCT